MAKEDKPRRNLVRETADKLRDMVFAHEPNHCIGSLQDLARTLGVGIVTVQQTARVLEHEGLLEVRRGPGGGYYGTRPDAAALERSITAYLRANPTSFEEALNITSLLFNELVFAAAKTPDPALKGDLQRLLKRLEACEQDVDLGPFEDDFQDLLFRMVEWPLFKLLTVVTLRFGVTNAASVLPQREGALQDWKEGRRRIIAAIIDGDAELARFEADRSNRRSIMKRIAPDGADAG